MPVRLLSLIALGLLSTAVHAAPPESEIDRLTDAAVQLMPMGRIFDGIAAKDPKWPAQTKPDAVTPDQLACLRSELSSDGYRRAKRDDVAAYARSHAARLKDDVAMVEAAAPVFGRLVMAGADGSDASPDAIVKSSTGEQLLAMTRLISDPDSADLRKLVGLGQAFSLTKSVDENKNSGEQLGASLAAQAMIKATITCKVAPGAFL